MQKAKQVIVIGGGAAGFFFAINCAQQHPDYQHYYFGEIA
jgi:predicted flavoprotein YhiN